MLPDFIDKPLGTWLLRDALSNGRVFGHTLLFALLLMGLAIWLYAGRGKPALLCLAFGSIAHLCLDEMWLNPRTLLWPLYGWSFERLDVSHWLERGLLALSTEPRVYVPEIIGALLLGTFLAGLIRRGKLCSFLRRGKVD